MYTKKIAIIADDHIGSTLPLIKQFISLGYKVDYYILCCEQIGNREAINIKSTKTKLGIQQITKELTPNIYSHVSSEHFRLLYFSTLRPYKSIIGLKNIIKLINILLVSLFCKKINNENYFAINYVGRYNSELLMFIEKNVICSNTITSLHEVCNHFKTNFNKSTKFLKYLFSNDKKIIVHSKKSYQDILKYKEVKSSQIFHVNFGIFDTYKIIPMSKSNSFDFPYFLFYGMILPYKGLNVLYDAVNLLSKEQLGNYKFVIAGRGNDPILEKISEDDRFVVINRFLSNEEIVELNYNARGILCPYLSVSQSGIIQTSFVFEKPIIASNIGSFSEILEHKITGLLFECGNPSRLADSILMLKNDDILYSNIVDNVKNFEKNNPDYSWTEITKKYINILNKN